MKKKKYTLKIIDDAETDLLDIYHYVALNASVKIANDLLNNLEKNCLKLEHMPARGHIPPELERIGVADYLEIHFKHYRIIYQITKNTVFIHCVLDGRRDLMDLLHERLLLR